MLAGGLLSVGGAGGLLRYIIMKTECSGVEF